MLDSAAADAEHIMDMVKQGRSPDEVMREINKDLGAEVSRRRIDGRVPRDSDDEALVILHLRCTGHSAKEIGDMFGTTGQYVSTLCNRILRADIQECAKNGPSPESVYRYGDPESEVRVRMAYW